MAEKLHSGSTSRGGEEWRESPPSGTEKPRRNGDSRPPLQSDSVHLHVHLFEPRLELITSGEGTEKEDMVAACMELRSRSLAQAAGQGTQHRTVRRTRDGQTFWCAEGGPSAVEGWSAAFEDR